MSKYTISKVTITTRKGKGTQVRTLSPTEIKKDTKINTFQYEGKVLIFVSFLISVGDRVRT